MSQWFFECICISDDQLEITETVTPVNKAVHYPRPVVEAVARKSVDRVVIYTGALGSRDYVDDDINDDNFSDTYSSFEYGVNDSGCPIWEWPQGFIPLDSWVNDPVKVELIADTERLIDMSDKDYHELARLTDFRLDKSTIVRYLEANLWQPRFPNGQTAAERIMATIDWRCNFPLPAVNLALLSTELATGKNFVHGKSKDGRPVVYLLLGKENTWDPDGNTMALVYTLERAIRSMSPAVQETICIVDCDGLGMMNSPSTAFLSKIIDILGRHYPRRNGQIFICNVSSVFYFVWNAISVTLSDVAKKKIQILTNDMVEMRKAIGAYIDVSVLSTDFGGDAKIKFDPNSYLAADTRLR
mmetsp:Transcript_9730/g.14664  ORF Transcript_9730/g.14664 Transcript_9730/m.14664 type:complete len:357 (-) Transcript_9730:107-1177(-)|eukprot:CAMPEP_0185028458 /NCGR_PEP_ID=MMETSP1103-20130426/14181_1 /TAXON_ID=36769 /ORGANISM="Paraphysomonas bandaiensis, Strain Caron Lab Isolate" /LENGTH=356 /DNA_ID=CAMNT_0027562883 /DNA_START=141 /DNA_END=1211 /DNA_ORIENTATION=-